MNSIYLSIDIDYWMGHEKWKMSGFLKRVLALGVPIKVVISHEELLPNMNGSKADSLFNVDHHSDMADDLYERGRKKENIYKNFETFFKRKGPTPLKLDEGTWANFVKFRKKGTFLWLYPDEECWKGDFPHNRGSGRCDIQHSPFSKLSKEICGWKEVKRRRKRLLTHKEWDKIIKIGICISPDWIDNYVADEAFEVLNNAGVLPKKVYYKVAAQFERSDSPLMAI